MDLIKQDRRIITQIGSLPYDNVENAVKYSLRHDIPFLPELPKLGEYMLDYIKNPGTLACSDEFKKHDFHEVKVQCVGPAALIRNGYDRDEAIEKTRSHISAILKGLKSKKTILFLDEPLCEANLYQKKLWDETFRGFNVVRGIHNCGDVKWNEMFDSDIEIISFDASRYKISGGRNGKRIAWGIESPKDAAGFQEGDLITLPCGMSPTKYHEADCERNLEMLLKASEKLADYLTRNY